MRGAVAVRFPVAVVGFLGNGRVDAAGAVGQVGQDRRDERPVRLFHREPLLVRFEPELEQPFGLFLFRGDEPDHALVETGTALEVNTSGLRQAAGETYPSAAVVARYELLGGTRISAGSDAHQKDAFASGLEAGYGVVAAAGFRELAFRRGGERLAVSVPDRFRTRSGPNEAASPSL